MEREREGGIQDADHRGLVLLSCSDSHFDDWYREGVVDMERSKDVEVCQDTNRKRQQPLLLPPSF